MFDWIDKSTNGSDDVWWNWQNNKCKWWSMMASSEKIFNESNHTKIKIIKWARWEKIKKDKHGKRCHNQRKHFSPFVLSVEGMVGREALFLLSQLSWVMVEKMEEPLLKVWGWETDALQSPLQGRTHGWSAELGYPVPCRNRSRDATLIRDRAGRLNCTSG